MITDNHRDFARAMVLLARQHGIGSFNLGFSLSVRAASLNGNAFGRVTMGWTEGRHGVENRITLSCEMNETLPEVADG